MSAINAHKEVERHNGLDLLKDAISLPGLTMRYLMRNLDKSQGDFLPHSVPSTEILLSKSKSTFGEDHPLYSGIKCKC